VTGLLLVEVIDTAGVILDAILWWIAAIALGVTAVVLGGAWAWRAVRRDRTGPLAASGPECDPSAANTPTKPTAPSWGRTQPIKEN
jgi:hypothetical protein